MSQSTTIPILLAEDHAVVRDGLAAILNRESDMTVVAEAEDGQQAVELYRLHQPAITLMDLRMPRLEGVGAIAQIRSEFPAARIIVLTTYDTDEDIYRGLQAGAKGYLLKDATSEVLLDAIRLVHQGKKYIPPEVALKLAERIEDTPLTERETDVIQLLVKGKSNHEISTILTISEGTVKFHINNILSKLGVHDRTQAVIAALKRGLARLE
ncbi:MAG: response regulator transcription factor [Cyanothece sp. SIO1E1]|nr:response regulator transcription factor [Cyanothece sp. SIO1E1]